MFVQRITNFIKQLLASNDLQEFDLFFLNVFEPKFLAYELDPDAKLPANLIDWRLIFTQRWKKIVDTPWDYTTCQLSESNACWIKLAYDLSKLLNKSYLQVLIPVAASQTRDPILLEHLAEYSTDCMVYVKKKTTQSIGCSIYECVCVC